MQLLLRILLSSVMLVGLTGCVGGSQTAESEPAIASPDAETLALGQKQFKYKCAACHSMEAGENSLFGPHLNGIVGRQIGTLADYPFSEIVADHDFVWTRQRLDDWLFDPQTMVPEMCMPFLGLRNPTQRLALLRYLEFAEVAK